MTLTITNKSGQTVTFSNNFNEINIPKSVPCPATIICIRNIQHEEAALSFRDLLEKKVLALQNAPNSCAFEIQKQGDQQVIIFGPGLLGGGIGWQKAAGIGVTALGILFGSAIPPLQIASAIGFTYICIDTGQQGRAELAKKEKEAKQLEVKTQAMQVELREVVRTSITQLKDFFELTEKVLYNWGVALIGDPDSRPQAPLDTLIGILQRGLEGLNDSIKVLPEDQFLEIAKDTLKRYKLKLGELQESKARLESDEYKQFIGQLADVKRIRREQQELILQIAAQTALIEDSIEEFKKIQQREVMLLSLLQDSHYAIGEDLFILAERIKQIPDYEENIALHADQVMGERCIAFLGKNESPTMAKVVWESIKDISFNTKVPCYQVVELLKCFALYPAVFALPDTLKEFEEAFLPLLAESVRTVQLNFNIDQLFTENKERAIEKIGLFLAVKTFAARQEKKRELFAVKSRKHGQQIQEQLAHYTVYDNLGSIYTSVIENTINRYNQAQAKEAALLEGNFGWTMDLNRLLKDPYLEDYPVLPLPELDAARSNKKVAACINARRLGLNGVKKALEYFLQLPDSGSLIECMRSSTPVTYSWEDYPAKIQEIIDCIPPANEIGLKSGGDNRDVVKSYWRDAIFHFHHIAHSGLSLHDFVKQLEDWQNRWNQTKIGILGTAEKIYGPKLRFLDKQLRKNLKTQLSNADGTGEIWNDGYEHLQYALQQKIIRIHEFALQQPDPENAVHEFALALMGFEGCPDGTLQKLPVFERHFIYKIPLEDSVEKYLSRIFAADRQTYLDQHRDARTIIHEEYEQDLYYQVKLEAELKYPLGLPAPLPAQVDGTYYTREERAEKNPAFVASLYFIGGSWQTLTDSKPIEHHIEPFTLEKAIRLIKADFAKNPPIEQLFIAELREDPLIEQCYSNIACGEELENQYFACHKQLEIKDELIIYALAKYGFINK